MSNKKAVCVFLGSSIGYSKLYAKVAMHLAKEIAKRKITLIYGGGTHGLMGMLASETLNNNGEVIGIITQNLFQKEGNIGLTNLYIVNTMHERKLLMAHLAHHFIALPGGLGTLEEIFEFWNGAKLGLHKKQIGLLNISDYYTKLFYFIQHSMQQGFIQSDHLNLIKLRSDPSQMLDEMFPVLDDVYNN